jgi:hypothetical protein
MKAPQAQWLKSLLVKWQSGEISARDVHEEAEAMMESCEWQELPRTAPESVMYEVLCQLDILNQQLIVADDIPAMLKFLGSTPSELDMAWQEWERYWNDVDFAERRRRLQGSDFYAV